MVIYSKNKSSIQCHSNDQGKVHNNNTNNCVYDSKRRAKMIKNYMLLMLKEQHLSNQFFFIIFTWKKIVSAPPSVWRDDLHQ